jgi:hypothetical protein
MAPRALALLFVLAAAVGLGAPDADAVTLPPANGAFDYQLGGAYPPPPGTQIVTRDRTESPLGGVC